MAAAEHWSDDRFDELERAEWQRNGFKFLSIGNQWSVLHHEEWQGVFPTLTAAFAFTRILNNRLYWRKGCEWCGDYR